MAAKKSVYVEVSTSKYDVDAVMKAAVKDYKANNQGNCPRTNGSRAFLFVKI